MCMLLIHYQIKINVESDLRLSVETLCWWEKQKPHFSPITNALTLDTLSRRKQKEINNRKQPISRIWEYEPGQPTILEMGHSDGSRSKKFDMCRVNFLWLGLGWVSHLWFVLEFGKFPLKNVKFFNFFLFGSKKIYLGQVNNGGLASYLLQVKSKLRSGQVRAHL